MRRQFALAVGGLLAASAVGLTQTMANKPAEQNVQYASPFMVAAPATAPVEAVGPQAMPANVQYIPVQAAPGQPVQYIAVQMVPQGQAAPQGQMMQAQYVSVQPTQAGMLPATPAANSTASMPAATATTSVSAMMAPTAPSMPTTVQYIPVQPVSQSTTVVQQPQPGTAQPATRPAPAPMPGARPAAPAPAQTTAPAAGCATGSCPTNQCAPTSCATGHCATGTCGAKSCNTCQTNTCDPCATKAPCGPDGQMWISAEYLLWWTKGMNTPALVTTSPAGTPRDALGVIGQPGTTVLFGGDSINDDLRSGFRLRGGYWLDCCRTCGLDAGFFFLGNEGDNASFNSGRIARPIDGDSQIINDPGLVQGRVDVNSSTDLIGFDVNFRKNWSCDCCNRVDWLIGFRYLKLEDDLTITEDLLVTGVDPNRPGLAPGTRFNLYDSFATKNEFYGVNVGLTGERRSGQMFVNWRGTVAFGTTRKSATIDGATTITTPAGVATTYPGGLLALPTNMGNYSRNDFSVVPEFGINVGYQFSENVRVFAGYSFLYWSNVTRAGDIIDTNVNTTQLPPGVLVGDARPAFSWNDTGFWAQGISFGAELRY